MVVPLEDRYSVSRNQLLDQMAWAMGGRVAEEIVFHDPTTGASNDFEKATNIARTMITQYGFSNAVGSVSYGNGGEVFIGRDMAQQRDYSEATAQVIDSEVRELVENAHNEAYKALVLNRAVLDELARQLMIKETLQADEVAKIFENVKKIPARKTWLSSAKRPVSNIPPIAIPEKAATTEGAKPAAKKAAAKKPTASKPAAPKATAAAKKPATRKPAAKKPASKAGEDQ
jgi:cell division protease FtsH